MKSGSRASAMKQRPGTSVKKPSKKIAKFFTFGQEARPPKSSTKRDNLSDTSPQNTNTNNKDTIDITEMAQEELQKNSPSLVHETIESMSSAQKSPSKASVTSSPPSKFTKFALEFLVIGVEREAIIESIPMLENALVDEIDHEPELLYSMMSENDSDEDQRLNCLASFLFPFGYKFEQIEKIDINEALLKDNVANKEDNFYFFCLNSEETVKVESEVDSRILKEANPSIFYHYYCLFTYVYYTVVSLLGTFLEFLYDFFGLF